MVLKKQLNCCTGVIFFYSFTLVFVCVCVGVFLNVVIHLIEITILIQCLSKSYFKFPGQAYIFQIYLCGIVCKHKRWSGYLDFTRLI